MYTDFIIEKQPTTVEEAMAIYENISSYFGDEKSMYNYSVPLEAQLVPLKFVRGAFKKGIFILLCLQKVAEVVSKY